MILGQKASIADGAALVADGGQSSCYLFPNGLT